MGIQEWIETDVARHLVRHFVTCSICLVLGGLLELLFRFVNRLVAFPPAVVASFDVVEYGYLILVIVIFAAGTIKSIWKVTFSGTLNGILA
jgi:hypothetical protein